jgi:hypothetical protein
VNPAETLARFDDFLVERGLSLDAVILGGAALALLGLVARTTKDCDVLEPALPPPVLEAARAFAAQRRREGEVLDADWLNNGPSSLVPVLPEGWRDRTVVAFAGRALILRALGRDDLLKTKLFGLCDRSTDLGDCLALRPTPEELRAARPWVEQQDANPEWPAHVRATLDDLARRLDHGL